MNGQRTDRTWPLLLIVWTSFLLYSAAAAPVPGVNEPHYLCKSRHFWQPGWCDRDFFLQSPNAHTVFYATIGSLTQFFSFDLSAWIGRSLGTLLLAWGWARCFSQIFLSPWSIVWSAWIYLAIASCGNFSGEWVVGGIEGKVFCYGFLLLALGDIYRQQWLRASAWAGLAVSFHPVVGVWGLLAFVLNFVVNRSFALMRRKGSLKIEMPLTQLLTCGLIFIALSLPGMIPVIRLLSERVSEDTRYAATYIQVYFRLAHHLDPMMFPVRSYVCYAVLLAVWLCGFWWGGRTRPQNLFDGIVAWAIVFALAGILVGLGPRPPKLMPFFAERMQLLKFYPFRLADALVPIALSVSVVCVLERSLFGAVFAHLRIRSFSASPLILLAIYVASLGRAYSVSETNRYSSIDRADWLDACHWIDANLPKEALVQSPTNGWAFKWFAQRSEYVAFKDCPQDAAGIVEWNRRLTFLQHWYDQHYSDEIYSADELRELHKQTEITHLLVDRLGPMDLEPIYRNGTFKVYDLRQLATKVE